MDMSIQDSHEAEKNLKSQATKFVKFDEELKGSSHGPMASCVSFFFGMFPACGRSLKVAIWGKKDMVSKVCKTSMVGMVRVFVSFTNYTCLHKK